MHDNLSLSDIQKKWHGTVRSYTIGFIASLLLTTASFLLVITRPLPEHLLIHSLIILALIQAAFQVIFFLHVGQEARPRWESISFYFMVVVLLIIALGSLWIIYDLNERVMPPMTMETPHD